ncbi:MAG: mannose-1-phosphate guanylyltransferase/mannose-6-phosphate isomerase [Hyphomicrobiales bacterium]|nr:mannose-1-phosphate guanylyltransferase/mannose-6-phosphate isomerase [Hyphomicrobiales bacterium]
MAEFSQPVQPVIMCGGSGTRLWPVSRQDLPKQFCALSADRTLLQQTLLRVRSDGFLAPVLACNTAQKFIVADQAAGVGVEPSAYLLEPVGRNTMAVAVTAALHAQKAAPGALVLLLPSDAHIADAEGFRAAVAGLAASVVSEGGIGLLGMTPERPETGYGYVRCGAPIPDTDGGGSVFRVGRFIEKPDENAAREFVEAGDFVWNAGIFLFSPETLLAEAERLKPDIVAGCRAAYGEATVAAPFWTLEPRALAALEAISLDRAVIEHTSRGLVARAAIGWSDLGSWAAIGEIMPHDEGGNAIHGEVIAVDTRKSVIWAEDRLVATLGIEDLAVIAVDDAVLVAGRGRAQEVSELVAALNRSGRPEARAGTTVLRPWGSFTNVAAGPGFQIKRILVKPGGRLSVQSHQHRAEHWVVVRGRPRVTCGEIARELGANEHIFIPLGARHRIENLTDEPAEIVEVQFGDYLGEDDIVRYEDIYGRI